MNATLDEMLQDAIGSLLERSVVLEKAPKMSLVELQNEIDNRIDSIASGKLEGDKLKQMKAEARTLALIKLRRK